MIQHMIYQTSNANRSFATLAQAINFLSYSHVLNIVELLSTGRKSTGEIAHALNISVPLASRVLRPMYFAGLLSLEPHGKFHIYRLRSWMQVDDGGGRLTVETEDGSTMTMMFPKERRGNGETRFRLYDVQSSTKSANAVDDRINTKNGAAKRSAELQPLKSHDEARHQLTPLEVFSIARV